MALSTLVKSFRFGGSRKGPGPRKAPKSRPAVETLEARELLCFSVTDLGAQSLGWLSGMNEWGHVAGTRGDRATVYAEGTFYDLGTPPGSSSAQGAGLNNNGQYIGRTGVGSWIHDEREGTWTFIPAFSSRGITARAINDAGQVVGSAARLPPANRAFLYENGTTYDLGTLGGGANAGSSAYAINSSGQVVGSSTHNGPGSRAFLYSDGVMSNLGTLGGTESQGLGINDRGQVVGVSTNAAGQTRAFLYSGGVMTDLGTLPGFTNSTALDISHAGESGEIVGAATRVEGTTTVSRAFSYLDGTMYDLNDYIPPDSGWVLESAQEVNDSSQIKGLGKLNGVPHYFLLNWQCWGNGPGPATDDGAGRLDTSVVAVLPASAEADSDFALQVTQSQPRDVGPARSEFSEQAWARALAEDATQPALASSAGAATDARMIDLAYTDLSQTPWLADGMPG